MQTTQLPLTELNWAAAVKGMTAVMTAGDIEGVEVAGAAPAIEAAREAAVPSAGWQEAAPLVVVVAAAAAAATVVGSTERGVAHPQCHRCSYWAGP